MNKLLIESTRTYIKHQISKEVDKLFDEIKKLSLENEDLKKTNAHKQKEINKLAYAYARKIGVILTQKEYNKKFKEKK